MRWHPQALRHVGHVGNIEDYRQVHLLVLGIVLSMQEEMRATLEFYQQTD